MSVILIQHVTAILSDKTIEGEFEKNVDKVAVGTGVQIIAYFSDCYVVYLPVKEHSVCDRGVTLSQLFALRMLL